MAASEPTGASLETFSSENPRLAQAGVGVHTVRWRWQFRPDPHQPWIGFQDTTHAIYSVLAVPGPPWQQSPFGPANTQLPWTAVSDYAVAARAGSTPRTSTPRRRS